MYLGIPKILGKKILSGALIQITVCLLNLNCLSRKSGPVLFVYMHVLFSNSPGILETASLSLFGFWKSEKNILFSIKYLHEFFSVTHFEANKIKDWRNALLSQASQTKSEYMLTSLKYGKGIFQRWILNDHCL